MTQAQRIPGRMPRALGTITRVVADGRGFGFLRDDDGQERFLHKSACMPAEIFDAFVPGDRVEFTPFEHANGARAIMVVKLGTRVETHEEEIDGDAETFGNR